MTCSIQKLNSGLLFQLQSPRQASNKTHESETGCHQKYHINKVTPSTVTRHPRKGFYRLWLAFKLLLQLAPAKEVYGFKWKLCHIFCVKAYLHQKALAPTPGSWPIPRIPSIRISLRFSLFQFPLASHIKKWRPKAVVRLRSAAIGKNSFIMARWKCISAVKNTEISLSGVTTEYRALF